MPPAATTTDSRLLDRLHDSCAQSGRHERQLRRRLAAQLQQTQYTEQLLQRERRRNAKLVKALRGECTQAAKEDAAAAATDAEDADETLAQARNVSASGAAYAPDTVSSMRTQYCYDELRYAYRRCMRQLHRKDRRLLAVSREHSLIADQFDELLLKHRQAHERLEFVCCRYLELYNRKSAELAALRTQLARLT